MAEHVDEIGKFIKRKIYNIEHSDLDGETKEKLVEVLEKDSKKFERIYDALVSEWEVKSLSTFGMKDWLYEFGREALEKFGLEDFSSSKEIRDFRWETMKKIEKELGYDVPYTYQEWHKTLFERGLLKRKLNPFNFNNQIYRFTEQGAQYLRSETKLDPIIKIKPVHEIPERKKPKTYASTKSTDSEYKEQLKDSLRDILKKDKGTTQTDIFTAYGKISRKKKWEIIDILDEFENVTKEIVFKEGDGYFLI